MTYLGWIGNAFLIAAAFQLGGKHRHAFLLTAIGEAIWIVQSNIYGKADMIFICVVFGAMAIWNYIRWGKNEINRQT